MRERAPPVELAATAPARARAWNQNFGRADDSLPWPGFAELTAVAVGFSAELTEPPGRAELTAVAVGLNTELSRWPGCAELVLWTPPATSFISSEDRTRTDSVLRASFDMAGFPWGGWKLTSHCAARMPLRGARTTVDKTHATAR